jgi:hypothetical protein
MQSESREKAQKSKEADERSADDGDGQYWDNDPVLHHHRANMTEKLMNITSYGRTTHPIPNYYGLVGELSETRRMLCIITLLFDS